MRVVIAALLIACASTIADAQQRNPAAEAARRWRQQHESAILREFVTLLSVPNTPRDKNGIEKNAGLLVELLRKRGVTSRLLEVPGGSPVVYGDLPTPGATHTIVFYAHYDGAPLDPKEWTTPPYQPILRNGRIEDGGKTMPFPAAGTPINAEWRLYARSAADDKAPIMAMLTALDAIRAAGLKTKSNIKFAFDGEEEDGSRHLRTTLETHRSLFEDAAVWLVCDGPVYQTRQQSVVFGARGIINFDLTVYGPRTELHSGHYGNWAPNPALSLARLLASMKDESGRVLIDGFYDEVEPLSALEKRAISEAPLLDGDLMRDFWLGAVDGAPLPLNELIALPSLNIRGIASGRTGAQASNVIPAAATATIDLRLVKGMTIQRTQRLVSDHLRKHGYFVVDSEPSADVRRAHGKVVRVAFNTAVEAERTSMDLPISQEVVATVESVRGPALKLPTMGGQLPLDAIVRPFRVPVIIVPTVNHDNNQHAANENVRIQNLWDAIELMAALLSM